MRLSDPPKVLRLFTAPIVIAAMCCVLIGALVASCTKQQIAQDIQDLRPAANCVLHAVEAGSNPVQVLGECVGTTIDGVIAIVEQYLTGDTHDSGALQAKHDVFRKFLVDARAHKAASAHP